MTMKRSLIFTLIGSTLLVLCASATTLGQCKNMLGRATERLCSGQPAFEECVTQLKAGTYEVCALEGHPESVVRRGTPEAAQAYLIKRGCKQLADNTFQCNEKADMMYCTGYQNYFLLFVTFPKPGEVAPTRPVAKCQFVAPTQDITVDQMVYYVGPVNGPIKPSNPWIKPDAIFTLPAADGAKCKAGNCTIYLGVTVNRSVTTEKEMPYVKIDNVVDGKQVHTIASNVFFEPGQAQTPLVLGVGLRYGENTLTVLVDANGEIAETNESNNRLIVKILVNPQFPDMPKP